MSVTFKTAEGVRIALRRRYGGDEWATFEELADATGARHRGWCDFVAMNLWPSRGLEIIGHEIKVSREDWLKEMRNPRKAEVFHQFCDRWYLVVGDPEIVRAGELPAGWGLMVPSAKGLKVTIEAERRTGAAPTRLFVAACCRAASRRKQLTPDDVEVRINDSYEKGRKRAEDEAKHTVERERKIAAHWQECADRLTKSIREFGEQTGIHIGSHWNAEQINAAVSRLMRGDLSSLTETTGQLDNSIRTFQDLITQMQHERKEIQSVIDRRTAEQTKGAA